MRRSIEARRPRLTARREGDDQGRRRARDWTKARTRQIDRDGRWTLKRGRKTPTPPDASGPKRQATAEIVGAGVRLQEPRRHRPGARLHPALRPSPTPPPTTAASSKPCSIRDNLASGVWADTAYRSAANLGAARPARAGAAVPARQAAGQADAGAHSPAATRRAARVRAKVEHVFAAQKRRLDLVIRTVGLARATTEDHARQPRLQHAPAGLVRRATRTSLDARAARQPPANPPRHPTSQPKASRSSCQA